MPKPIYIALDVSSDNIKGICNGATFTIEHIRTTHSHNLQQTNSTLVLKDTITNKSFVLIDDTECEEMLLTDLFVGTSDLTNMCERIKLSIAFGILTYLSNEKLVDEISTNVFVIIGMNDSVLLAADSDKYLLLKQIVQYFNENTTNILYNVFSRERISFELPVEHLFFIPATVGTILTDRHNAEEYIGSALYINLHEKESTILLVNDGVINDFLSSKINLPKLEKILVSDNPSEEDCIIAAVELIQFIRENVFTLNSSFKRICISGQRAHLIYPLFKENMISTSPYFLQNEVVLLPECVGAKIEYPALSNVWGIYHNFKKYIECEVESEDKVNEY